MLEQWRNQTNLINVVFAAILFLSPWMLGFSYEAAGLNAWASGLLLGLVSVLAILTYAEWEEWIDLALGAWILASPWALNFPAGSAATKVHVFIGLIVTVLAVAELWKEHHAPEQPGDFNLSR
jgi:heme/copper-type cytochrome/quinol oxidase subunit 3